nr:MAG TPA: hypothetical protein [Bacteriophage sp.]
MFFCCSFTRNIFINCYKNTNFSQCSAHLRKVFEKFPEKFVFICQTIKFVSKNNLSQVVFDDANIQKL